MLEKILQPGDKVKIYYMSTSTERYYLSQVEEIDGDNVLVSAPIKLGRVIPLSLNKPFIFDFYSNSGIYRTVPTITNRSKDGNLFFLHLKVDQDAINKIQRRNYFRVDCIQPMKVKGYEPPFDSKLPLKDELPEDGTVINISGGGVKFITTNQYEPDSIVQLELILDVKKDRQLIPMEGKVISCDVTHDRTSRYIHRVKITDILPRNREKIIRFVFDQQVRQKGK